MTSTDPTVIAFKNLTAHGQRALPVLYEAQEHSPQGMTPVDMCQYGIDRISDSKAAMDALVTAGLATRTGSGRRGVYRITDAGRSLFGPQS